MTITMARLDVGSPPFTPSPYGLLSVADRPTDADTHWRLGVRHTAAICDPADVTIGECLAEVRGVGDGTAGITKAPTATGMPTMGGDPFSVYAWIDCAVPGFFDEAEDRTVAALTNGEARAIEQAFWTGASDAGAATIHPHLASDTEIIESGEIVQLEATPVVTGATGPVDALGQLEEALASCYGGQGVIHVTRRTLVHLTNLGLVRREGQRLFTPGGNLIAAGDGYTGSGPGNTTPAAGVQHMYATGSVALRRSAIKSTPREQSIDRNVNTMVMISERTYVITWDCCLLTIPVQLTS